MSILDTEIVVAGGGPAGATAANLLAKAGLRVLLLEKEQFPRFHIGESLLPCDLALFERLGLDPASFDSVKKQGAEFIDEALGETVEYLFRDAMPPAVGSAWQVERSQFDHALLQLAQDRGVDVLQRVKVGAVDIQEDRVVVEHSGGTSKARYFIDATGQDALLGRRTKTVEPIKGFGRAAVFAHFTDLSDAVNTALVERGNIKIFMLPDGWAWLIPLGKNRLSLGVVSRQRGIGSSILEETIAASPILQELTAGSTRGTPSIIRNFSFVKRQAFGARYACIGDAACFLDPVFSSGASCAMLGGELVADRLVEALADEEEAKPDLMAPVEQRMHALYDSFGSLIRSFYSTRLVRNLFFANEPEEEIVHGLVSLLAGDVWRKDNRFQDMLLRSRRRWRVEESHDQEA